MHQKSKTAKNTKNTLPPRDHPSWEGICPYTNKASVTYYRAYAGISLAGKKITKSFRDFNAAVNWRKEKKTEMLNHGRKRLDVSDELIGKATRLESLCETHGGDIQEAVLYWIRHTRPEGGALNVAELIKLYLNDPVESLGWSPKHRENLGSLYQHFEDNFGNRLIHDLKDTEITKWILKPKNWGRQKKGNPPKPLRKWSEKTMDNAKLSLSAMFTFAILGKHLATNPCAKLRLPEVPDAAIRVLSLPECIDLLRAAWITRESVGLLHYTLVCLFGGLRPSEACRVTWEDIRKNSSEPNIRAQEHKDGINVIRYVDIQPVLSLWLDLCPGKRNAHDSILPPRCARAKDPFESTQKLFRQVRDVSRIEDWGRDAMRHTFASTLYAVKKDVGYLRNQLGHEDGSRVTLRHYICRRVLIEEGKKFWELTPQIVLGDAFPLVNQPRK